MGSVGQCAEVEEGPEQGGEEAGEGGAGRRGQGGGRGRGGAGGGRAQQLDKREPDRKGAGAGDVRRGGRWQVGKKGMLGSLRMRMRRMRRKRLNPYFRTGAFSHDASPHATPSF